MSRGLGDVYKRQITICVLSICCSFALKTPKAVSSVIAPAAQQAAPGTNPATAAQVPAKADAQKNAPAAAPAAEKAPVKK